MRIKWNKDRKHLAHSRFSINVSFSSNLPFNNSRRFMSLNYSEYLVYICTLYIWHWNKQRQFRTHTDVNKMSMVQLCCISSRKSTPEVRTTLSMYSDAILKELTEVKKPIKLRGNILLTLSQFVFPLDGRISFPGSFICCTRRITNLLAFISLLYLWYLNSIIHFTVQNY